MTINDIKDLLKAEANAVQNIPVTDDYFKVIDLFYNQVHTKGGKIIISGMGKAGQLAINIATTFCSTGTPAVFLHPSDAQHGDLGIIRPNDVLLLISNSGKTREILELVDLSRNLNENLPIVVLTGNKDGSLAKLAYACLHTGGPAEVCPLGLTPTTSTTTFTVIGDILVVMMMKKINFSAEEYAKRHHGGYLGQLSRQQISK